MKRTKQKGSNNDISDDVNGGWLHGQTRRREMRTMVVMDAPRSHPREVDLPKPEKD